MVILGTIFILAAITSGEAKTMTGQADGLLSAETERALSRAALEARLVGSDVINTTHLLLGILQDDMTDVAQVFSSFRIDYHSVYTQYELTISDATSSSPIRGDSFQRFSPQVQETITNARRTSSSSVSLVNLALALVSLRDAIVEELLSKVATETGSLDYSLDVLIKLLMELPK